MVKRKLKRNDVQSRTIAMVCELLEPWDAQVNNSKRLSDCVLFKLNLIDKRQVRRNKVDDCVFCRGTKGGVPGNENLIGGLIVCDYCTVVVKDMLDGMGLGAVSLTQRKG